MTSEELVKRALNEDIDLSKTEYKAKQKAADARTANHGVNGTAPLSETVRQRRIQTNFYATMLNVSLNILAALDAISDKLDRLTDKKDKEDKKE